VYLHYALDLWAERVVRRQLRGEFYLVRYADDVVFAFQYPDDAARFAEALRARLGKFGLRLNDAKTRLIEFGRFAKERRARRNQKPETFDFLGLTHIVGRVARGGLWSAVGPPPGGCGGRSVGSPRGAGSTGISRSGSSGGICAACSVGTFSTTG
jgi:Reverse transcriptase (RNA-dependent DNA polymerase)